MPLYVECGVSLCTIFKVWLYILVECAMCKLWIVNMCYSYEMFQLLIWNILKINVRQWVSLVKCVEWTDEHKRNYSNFCFHFRFFLHCLKFRSCASRKKGNSFCCFQAKWFIWSLCCILLLFAPSVVFWCVWCRFFFIIEKLLVHFSLDPNRNWNG